MGDMVSVKDGHARNYLFPKKLAKPSTPSNQKEVEAKKARQAKLEEVKQKEASELRDKLANISCTISVQSGEDQKLYGSVTTEIIAKAFEAEGIMLDKKEIQLDEPIKKLGVYNIPVRLHPQVIATLKVWIVEK